MAVIRVKHHDLVRSVAQVGKGDNVCLLRDHTQERLFYYTNPGKVLVCLIGEEHWHPEAQITVTVDPATDCRCPWFWLIDSIIEGVYLRAQTPMLARSRDHARHHKMITIPGIYEQITAVNHRNRFVLIGYHNDQWFARVGRPNFPPNPTVPYLWSGETVIGSVNAGTGAITPLLNPDKFGYLRVREDHKLEFGYLDKSGAPHVVTCGNLDSLTAKGSWT